MGENVNKIDRVRKISPKKANQQIDNEINQVITQYKGKRKNALGKRIVELDKEWSIERRIETFASSLILSGLLLGTLVNRKWLILPGVVATFLLQHGIQGWCPPVPLFRLLKARTRKEIDWEKNALKYIRGDFDKVPKTKSKQIFEAVQRV